jgi:hypothetical protein
MSQRVRSRSRPFLSYYMRIIQPCTIKCVTNSIFRMFSMRSTVIAHENILNRPGFTGMKEPNTNRNSSHRDTLEAHAINFWADARRAFE